MEPAHEPHHPAAPDADRVRDHTAGHVNDRIDRETRLATEAAEAGGTAALLARLAAIEREWDVDRALMANFAVLGGASFAASVAAAGRGRRRWSGWHSLLSVQLAFLLGHAIVGWCPPLPVFRRLGFRTAKEIGRERCELLARLRDGAGPATG